MYVIINKHTQLLKGVSCYRLWSSQNMEYQHRQSYKMIISIRSSLWPFLKAFWFIRKSGHKRHSDRIYLNNTNDKIIDYFWDQEQTSRAPFTVVPLNYLFLIWDQEQTSSTFYSSPLNYFFLNLSITNKTITNKITFKSKSDG